MDDVQLLADFTVRHFQEVGKQDDISLALRQLRQGVSQKIAGHDYRESQHFKDMLAHKVLVPHGGLLQFRSCQLAQGFLLGLETGKFALDVPGLILQNLDAESAKLILNTLLIYFPNASVEDIEYRSDRKLNRNLLQELGTCRYILDKRNVILMGATGAGKTYIACALGTAACRNLYTVKYIRLPDLLNELAVARGEGCYMDVMKFYRKVSLLILDEWMLIPLTKTESRDLLEIVEARYERSSTIFCSQFAPPGWHERIAEDALADAVLDRIENSSYKILIDGDDSMRKRKGFQSE